MKRRRAVGLVIVATGVCAVAASAAPKDPLGLVLARADVPGAKLSETARGPAAIEQGFRRMGIRTRVARYAYVEVPASGPHDVSVFGIVLAANDTAGARKAFAFLKRESLRRARAAQLERFGDEQLATYTTNAGADLLVRRNRIVWALSVRASGAEELSWPQVRPDLVKYATRQQRRIEPG